jgi:hypothetical protein
MHEVDAVIVVREGGAAIDDEDPVLLLDGKAVHADFAEPTERYQADGIGLERGAHANTSTAERPSPEARGVERDAGWGGMGMEATLKRARPCCGVKR